MTQYLVLTRPPSAFIPYASRRQISFAGDSLTLGTGSTSTGGYRKTVIDYISALDGGDPNIIGSDYAGTYSYPMLGASGITSSTLKTTVETALAGIPSLTMPVAPSAVFLMIGINDLLSAASMSTWLDNVESIITSFRTANTNSHIFVSNLIDRSGYTGTVITWNTALLTRISGMSGYNSNIHYVDGFSAVGSYSGTNYSDVTHLNLLGYSTLLAPAFYTAFDSVY